ncbi:hypothetical protein ACFVZC_02245 [Streptomyces marokkonensis]|uniref:Uncharacterized protein n=1 Tax=Streptomyces marokkonensis TaxID=324855 RepID=A0ABW6PZH0_9ACTN
MDLHVQRSGDMGSPTHIRLDQRQQRIPQGDGTHDFPDHELGKAVPYGIYDIAAEQRALTTRLTVHRHRRCRPEPTASDNLRRAAAAREHIPPRRRLRRCHRDGSGGYPTP